MNQPESHPSKPSDAKSQEWSKEPWHISVENNGGVIIFENGAVGHYLAETWHSNKLANARRIVECVNFCAGVPRSVMSPASSSHIPLKSLLDETLRQQSELAKLREELKAEKTKVAEYEKVLSDDLSVLDTSDLWRAANAYYKSENTTRAMVEFLMLRARKLKAEQERDELKKLLGETLPFKYRFPKELQTKIAEALNPKS